MYKSISLTLSILFAISGMSAHAANIYVTSTASSGAGTLRQAILDANATAGSDNIVFEIPGAGVHILTFNTLLPKITRPVHIQGYTQGAASVGPIGSRTILIQVNGSSTTDLASDGSRTSASSDTDGFFRFTSTASGSSISGLSIINTGLNVEAILVEPGITGMHIWGNYIGVTPDGKKPAVRADSNGDDGVFIGEHSTLSGTFTNVFVGTDGNGVDDANEGNVISSNGIGTFGGDGIQVGAIETSAAGYTYNNVRISGNYIGVEADGVTEAGNGVLTTGLLPQAGSDGINLVQASNILIGTDANGTSDSFERNIISGNYANGIDIFGGPGVTIAGNYVGTDKTGTIAIPNGKSSAASGLSFAGILVRDNSSAIIGFNSAVHDAGDANVVRNVVSGNYVIGIAVYNGTRTTNRISGNYVGVDVTGNTALGNGQSNNNALARNGIYVIQQPSVLIGTDGDGDDDELERNVVSGNLGNGIHVVDRSHNVTVAGNYVGVGADGATAIGNEFVGVLLDGVNDTRVGSDDGGGPNDANEANIIANNAHGSTGSPSDGIRVIGNATRNRLSRNVYYNNGGNPIDLSNDGVTVNDGTTTASNPNILIDYPVITSYSVSGSTVTVSGYVGACNGSENTPGATISGQLIVQLYKTADDGDQNGAISTNGCSRIVTHGEGGQYLGSITITGGTFTNQTFTLVSGATFLPTDLITGITIDANGNTSEFGVLTYIKISGKVWNDADGNVIQDGAEAGTDADGGLYVNLVNSGGTVIASALVDANGNYTLDGPASTSGLKLVLVTSNTATTPGTLPTGWFNTGENVGSDNTASQTSTLSQIELTTGTTDVTLQNFGIKTGSLPVTLTRFEVTKENVQSQIVWSTTAETNTYRFEIERSGNASDWNLIGSKNAAGESNSLLNYLFVDVAPMKGDNYYRLKMIDNDGTYAYSRIRSIAFGEVTGHPVIYPNPASEFLLVKDVNSKQIREVVITSLTGKTVYKSASIASEGINVSGLSGGMYLVKIIQTNGTESVQKLLINK